MREALSNYGDEPVRLNVYISGIVAFVPDHGGRKIWALMPNALVPQRARWRPSKNLLSARSPHMSLLIVDACLLEARELPGKPRVIYEAAHGEIVPPGSTYPFTLGKKAVIDLNGDELYVDSDAEGDQLDIDPCVDLVPKMNCISSAHRYVSRRFHPRSEDFCGEGLSSAFCMETGHLAVAKYFGDTKPEKVKFGYVSWPFKLLPRVWNMHLANQLVWTLTYPPDKRYIALRKRPWEEDDPIYEYILKVPPETKVIDVAVMHTEPELPFLFLGDPRLPQAFARLPDPDFEAFYALSNHRGSVCPWRVPVHSEGPAGTVEKPCAGSFFEGFEK